LFSCFSNEDLKHIPKIMEFKGEYLRVLEPKQKLWEVDHSAIPDPQKIEFFQNKTVGEIARHQYFPVSDDRSLLDIVNVLVDMPKLRRIPIVADNKLKRIVTPMDIVKLLVSKDLGKTGQLKVSDVNLHQGKAEIVKISKDATALEGFRLLETKNITGLAVVDDQNKVVGSLSISDLKAIMYDASEFINLHLPVSDFIRKVRQRDSLTPQGDISVTSQSTLSDVLNCFAKYQVHRVFIVDDAHILKGPPITLGDFLVAVKKYSL
jgi:CBS domain-containing protein